MSGGGKSRKAGGVSKKLINALKSGKYSGKSCGTSKTVKDENKTTHPTLFKEDGGTKD
jgi:hypothetical protein